MKTGTSLRMLLVVVCCAALGALCAALGACGKGGGKKPGKSTGAGSAFDSTTVVRAIGARDYDTAYAFLSEPLADKWPKEQFAKQLGAWRAAIGKDWSPELTGHGRTARELSVSYALTSEANSTYRLNLVARPLDDGYKITFLNATAPADEFDPQLAKARETAHKFLAFMEAEDYAAARALIVPQFQDAFTEPTLRDIRALFWKDADGTVEFTEQEALRGVANGTPYYRIDSAPEGRVASLKLDVREHDSTMMISTIQFGIKVAE